ncbi:MAG: transposase [Phycisphaerales bacterium]|nr:transposase [Phycisphaerales bacterium]
MARKVYSEEFKKGAVEQVIAQRHTAASVAERLGVGYDTLRKWVELARYNADKSLVPTDLPAEQRIRELEKENARLRTERDILKKAAAYFAKENL